VKKKIRGALAAAALLVASSAQAVAICNTNDVTLATAVATSCAVNSAAGPTLGLGGNPFTLLADQVAPGNSGTGLLGGGTFNLGVTRTDDGSDPTFAQGGLSLSWSGLNGPLTLDLILVVEQGTTGFASYFFNDLVLNTATTTGTWLLGFLGLEDTAAPFLGLYARDLVATAPPPPPPQVLEPGMLGLIGLGILGLGLVRRRLRPRAALT
jgi:hypothetical protein